jgi:hypothetical protein
MSDAGSGASEAARDAELRLGRALVRTNLWRIVWVSLVVGGVAASAPGARPLASAARLGLIVLTALLVYRGLRWALWLLGAMTVLAGIAMVVVAFVHPDLDWLPRALFAVGGTAQVLSFLVLVKAPEVRAYMASRRGAGGGR